MQDFQSIPGLTDRIFSGGGGGGGGGGGSDNRRLRGYPSAAAQPHQPPVKCPRCDSANTKFCYYNNYNLSQPRHFCKSCRRYWTKGGVLRNVPVGGGCRKAKRSSSKSSAKTPSSSSSVAAAAAGKDRRRPPASGSSSDSSSLTATDASASAPAAASASASASFPDSGALFPSQTSDHNPSPAPPFDPAAMEPIGQAAPEIYPEAGSFTSLMAAATSGPAILGFNYSDPPPPPPAEAAAAFRLPDQQQPQQKEEGFVHPTASMDLPPFHGRSGGGGGLTGLDWPAAVDPGFFDLTSSVDPAVYWNQNHWGDTDPSLYLP